METEYQLMLLCLEDMQNMVDDNPEHKVDLAVRLKQLRQVIDDTYARLKRKEMVSKARWN